MKTKPVQTQTYKTPAKAIEGAKKRGEPTITFKLKAQKKK